MKYKHAILKCTYSTKTRNKSITSKATQYTGWI